jgi:hypothetical protein
VRHKIIRNGLTRFPSERSLNTRSESAVAMFEALAATVRISARPLSSRPRNQPRKAKLARVAGAAQMRAPK